MGTRGRFKGWKSAKAIAAMTPDEKAEYDALVARVKAERDAEKLAKGIDPEKEEAKKKEEQAKKEEKQINLQNLIKSQLEYQKTHIMSQDEDEEEKNGKPWYEPNNGASDYRETSIDHLSGEGFCTIETNEDFWIRKIQEMIEKTPDKVIVEENFSHGDIIRVKIPYSCMKKIKTSARIVSEEQRKRMSELGKQATGRKRGRPRKNPTENPTENPVEEPVESITDIPVENTPVNTPVNEVAEPLESQAKDNTQIDEENTSTQLVEGPVMVENPTTPVEESDEEFENKPMNRFRKVEVDEDENDEDLSDQEKLTGAEDEETESEENDFSFCSFGTMSFGNEPVCIRVHEGPEDSPNDDLDKYYGEDY